MAAALTAAALSVGVGLRAPPGIAFLCPILPRESQHPPWAMGENISVRYSKQNSPHHFFDWDVAHDCAWAIFIEGSTYVDLEAVSLRLRCLDNSAVLVLGRLSFISRTHARYPVFMGKPLIAPNIGAGLVVSSAARAEFGRNVELSCDVATYDGFFDHFSSMLHTEGHVDTFKRADDVNSPADFATAACMNMAKLPAVQAFGHGIENFVLGPKAADRTMIRRAYGGMSSPSRSGKLVVPRPCVLVAHPVSVQEQHMLSRGRGYCSSAVAIHFAATSATIGSEIVADDSNYVSKRIAACGVMVPPPSVARLPAVRPLFPGEARLTLLVGLPGGATTWFYDAVAAAHGNSTFKHSAFFHPFCNELFRSELSSFVGATEDYSFINIFREKVPEVSFDHLVRFMIRHVLAPGETLPTRDGLVTRESVNIWRIPDLVRMGFRAFALYRHRKHTFPLSDAPDDTNSVADFQDSLSADAPVFWSTLCRTCFYLVMHKAATLTGDFNYAKSVQMVRELLVHITSPIAQQVATHTLFWYVMLFLARRRGYAFPIIEYARLMDLPAPRVLPYLRSRLPHDVDARIVATEVVKSRKSAAWLKAREARYASYALEGEYWSQKILQLVRKTDPKTDVSLLS
eukprot:TRINITY_DN45510_c0_g1_i1.p1 TRINITY_DN45510_c0_g1~~TRINITY_DN45510_c0_g1_i1.p1  ORF type:complete len:647 (-),score=51.21 TRINITY_DN45510_c0_g1_i1:301-2184(-)